MYKNHRVKLSLKSNLWLKSDSRPHPWRIESKFWLRGHFTHTLGSVVIRPADIIVMKDTEGEGKFKCCQALWFCFFFRAASVALFLFFLQLFLQSILGNTFIEKKSYCETLQSKAYRRKLLVALVRHTKGHRERANDFINTSATRIMCNSSQIGR